MPQMILQNDCTKNLFNANHPTMAISEDVSLEFSFQNVFFFTKLYKLQGTAKTVYNRTLLYACNVGIEGLFNI